MPRRSSRSKDRDFTVNALRVVEQAIGEHTRLTNAFSKKVENHGHAIALYFMFYNFCRIHQTLRVTPAMETGLSNHVWTIEELVGLLERI